MTKRRVDVVWAGVPTPEMRQSAQRAVQRGALSAGYLGSVRLRFLPDGRVQVLETTFSAVSDPWRGTFAEPETARRWLVEGLGPDHVFDA